MPYFSFKGNFNENEFGASDVRLLDNTPILLSRSGYTGEFGFEIFLTPDQVFLLWTNLLSAGNDIGILPCGLAARDSLRAGACLPLSHQDIGDWKFIRHPWEFALPFSSNKTAFTKNFIGSDALLDNDHDPYIYPFVGDSLRKVSANENTRVLDNNKNDIGKVLTCATDMGITWHKNKILSVNSKDLPEDIKIKGISCGFIMVSEPQTPGTKLLLQEGKRKIKATVVTDVRPDRTARQKLDNFI
jgi:aminomethyltransferase